MAGLIVSQPPCNAAYSLHKGKSFPGALECSCNGASKKISQPTDGASEKVFAKVFAKARRKKSISHIVRTPWHVREVESYALSKFQPPTTLGGPQNVENTIWKKFYLFWFGKSVLRQFGEASEELRSNERQNQLQRQILHQIELF